MVDESPILETTYTEKNNTLQKWTVIDFLFGLFLKFGLQ